MHPFPGEAPNHAKHFNHVNCGWSAFADYADMCILKLLGDPSMVRAGQ